MTRLTTNPRFGVNDGATPSANGKSRFVAFVVLVTAFVVGVTCRAISAADATLHPYFVIHIIDAETGRGVPLAELETVNRVVHVSDSAGIVAFNEPGFMDGEVYFHVRSPG